jgi:septal ring factor EnvC (AmiA/AmiB activator)
MRWPRTLAVWLLLCSPPALMAQEVRAPYDGKGRMLLEIIDTLERDLEAFGRKRRGFNRKKESLENELARLQERILAADRELKKSKKQIEKLLRSVVLMKEPDDLLLFFSTMKYHDLHVYKRSIRKITEKLSEQLTRLVAQKKTLDRHRATLAHQADKLNLRRQGLLEEIGRVEAAAGRAKAELAERTRKIAAIENLFMTATIKSPYVDSTPDTTAFPGGEPDEDLTDYHRKHDLQIPISPGKLIKGFEEMPEAPYGTEKMVRGWLLVPFVSGKKKEARETAFVRTPFEGVVVFVGEIPGFGLTMVVDHGHDYHTVYGNLHKIQVIKGDALARNQNIGIVRSANPQGGELPYLYFEFRQHRIAVDPKQWFRLRPLQPAERS